MVILTDEDFADLPLTQQPQRSTCCSSCRPSRSTRSSTTRRTTSSPRASATKPYVLLRDALTDSDRVAIVKVALRQREQLATLRVRDGVLVLNTMLWPDEVRAASFDFLDEDVDGAAAGAGHGRVADRLDGRPTSSPRSSPTTTGRRCSRSSTPRSTGEEIVAPPEAEEAPDRRDRPDGRAAGLGRAGQGRARSGGGASGRARGARAGRPDPDLRRQVGRRRRPRRPLPRPPRRRRRSRPRRPRPRRPPPRPPPPSAKKAPAKKAAKKAATGEAPLRLKPARSLSVPRAVRPPPVDQGRRHTKGSPRPCLSPNRAPGAR